MLRDSILTSQKRIKNWLLSIVVLTSVLLLLLFLRFFLNSRQGSWQFITTNEIVSNPDYGKEFQPLVFDQKNVYLTNLDGYIYALDKQTGKEKWHFRTNERPRHGLNISSDSLVYAADFDGRVYAVDKQTGKEKWRFITPGLINPDTPPFLSEDFLYFGSRNGILYALNKHTGEKKWEFKTKGVDNSQVIVDEVIFHFGQFSIDENSIYINSATDDTIYCLNKRTGQEKWRFTSHKFNFSKPVVGKEIVVFRSNDNFLYALDKQIGQLKWRRLVAEHDSQGIFDDSVYYKDKKGNFYVLDSQTGREKWSYATKELVQEELVIKEDRVYLTSISKLNSGKLVVLDKKSGELNWQFKAGLIEHPPQVEGDIIYLGSGGDLYALEIETGKELWRFMAPGTTKYVFITEDGAYLVNSLGNIDEAIGDRSVFIYFIDKKTGEKKWQFKTDDIDITTPKESSGNLFFLTKDRQGFFTLRKDQSKETIKLEEMKKINFIDEFEKDFNIGKKVLKWIKDFLISPEKRKIQISSEVDEIEEYDVYELTIKHDDSVYDNVWEEVDISAKFTNKDRAHSIKGFYYDQDTWKVRFAPTTPGEWHWKLTFSSSITKKTKEASFAVKESNKPGFVRIRSTDPHRFTFDNGELFNAIGLQDCFIDHNHNGNPLDQWAIGINEKPDKKQEIINYSDLETYLQTYGPEGAGFNLFRWNVDNCSYKLWRDIIPGNNFYDINRGIQGDELIKSLKENDFQIWMSIFGFKIPLIHTTPQEDPFKSLKISNKDQLEAIKKYLDYVVARYASYIDIWELANEVIIDEELITSMAEYLRSIDPYSHPITISWERPDLPTIEINSVHWYEREPELESDLIMANKIAQAKKWKKPVVLSEHGNAKSNWDKTSALRMRIRSWTAFFEEAIIIFWNTSYKLFQPENMPGNIYLGPKERQYIRILQDFTSKINPDLEKDTIDLKTEGIRAYALRSSEHFLVYLHHFENHSSPVRASFAIGLPRDGTLEWINPENGDVLERRRINFGNHILSTPWFKLDLALRIRFSD